jgi:hypothetical protein
MAVSLAKDFKFAISTEEYVCHHNGGDDTAEVGQEAGRNSMARMTYPHRAEVNGQDVECRISGTLEDTGEVIYAGKAHKRPGADSNLVRINDVCADWLENVLPYLSQAEFTELNLPVTFNVLASTDGETWTTKGSFQFINDWSYDYGYDPETMGMSFPINGRVDLRMPIVWTGLDVSQVTATITFTDGTTAQVIIPVAIAPDFNNDFNNDFSIHARSAGSGTAVFFLDEWENVSQIAIGNAT